MILDTMEKNPGARFLLILASFVVVVAGLRAAAPVLVPFALALFLAIVSMPVMFFLRRHRVGAPLAIFLTVSAVVGVFVLIGMIATNSVGDLNQNLVRYQFLFEARATEISTWMSERGLPVEQVSEAFDGAFLDWNSLFGGVLSTLGALASLLSLAFLVALIMVFILAEATVFPYKFQAIFGDKRTGRTRLAKTIREVQAYLGIKFLVSLATGLTAGVFCWLMNLDFPVLLGITAFVLNFVPTIGSIIAAIPAMVLAFILHDVSWTLMVGVGYFAINTLFGNIIEPNLMGRRLGLSTLVVVLSLIFWYWVWGPIGALLSVPLTMVLKIGLENTPDLKWAAVLLDKAPPQAHVRGSASATSDEPSGADEGSSEAGEVLAEPETTGRARARPRATG